MSDHEMVDQWLETRIAAYHEKYAGPKIKPLSRAVPLKIPGLARIREAVPHILAAQQTLLRHFLAEAGPVGTLEFFGVPTELSRWMTVFADPGITPPLLRVDALPLPDGDARICEINIGSCVGVAEAADLFRIEEMRSGRFTQQTPYEHLAAFVGQQLAKINGSKVCLFDWSHWQESGWFTLERLRETLSAGLPGIEVFLADEHSGIDRVDSQTVVFRIFPSVDAMTDPALITELFNRAGHVVTDFSSDLLSSKLWLALYHDDGFRSRLTDQMRQAIDETIPWTTAVDSLNMESLFAEKDRYFFKSATDFGGRGVLAGHNSSASEIRSRILESGPKRWVAQEKCDTAPLDVQPLGSHAPIPSIGVLGIYRFGVQWSGVLVRAAVDTEVVNVSGGSFLGWGYEW